MGNKGWIPIWSKSVQVMECRADVLWSEGAWNSDLAVVGYHGIVKNSYRWTSWAQNVLPKEEQPLAYWPPVHYLIAQVEQDVNTSIAQFDRISIWKPQLMPWVLYSIAKLYFVSVTNEKRGHICHLLSMGWPGNSHLPQAVVSIYKHKGGFVSLSQSILSGLWGKMYLSNNSIFISQIFEKRKSPKLILLFYAVNIGITVKGYSLFITFKINF